MNTLPQRKPNRLSGYDYSSPGYYFVTICTHQKRYHFANVVDGKIQLTKIGQFCLNLWHDLPERFEDIELDGFTVMPNHIHGILYFKPSADPLFHQENESHPRLGTVIGAYKSLVNLHFIKWSQDQNFHTPSKLWQRSYYDHVIRNEKSLDAIRSYIQSNPLNWEKDPLFIKK